MGVGANASECVGRCLWLSLSLYSSLTLSISLAFALTFAWWRIAVILALTCLLPLLSVSCFFSLPLCLRVSFLSIFSQPYSLSLACLLSSSFSLFLSLCLSIILSLCRVLSHSVTLCVSLSLSLSGLCFSLTLSLPFSLSLCLSLSFSLSFSLARVPSFFLLYLSVPLSRSRTRFTFQDLHRSPWALIWKVVQWGKESFHHWVVVFDFANCPVCVSI